MATTYISTASLVGLEGALVTVEADVANGLPSFAIVGLPDTAVKEARERIRAAMKNSGYTFPRMRVTVNLAPADVRKEGTAYDLPIALAILCASDEFRDRIRNRDVLQNALFVGELALSGDVRSVHGMLSFAVSGVAAGKHMLFCPEENGREACLVSGCTIFPTPTLRACMEHLLGDSTLSSVAHTAVSNDRTKPRIDFADIVGNDHAKRALTIAAAGNHHLRMVGPPGSGKTMLAQALAGILPQLTNEEVLTVTRIWSVAGLLPSQRPWMDERPFRDPHHSASLVALVGGGTIPRPGEVSLAHHGVLFLDEFPEFPRSVLESLRQPLEEGSIMIARASDHVRFPARFLLVAAQNPCPCGYAGDQKKACVCPPGMLTRYRTKISGPLLDRIDLHIEVPRLPVHILAQRGEATTSEEVRAVVAAARARQAHRFIAYPWETNAEIPSTYLRQHCPIDDDVRAVLHDAVERFQLSGRVYFRTLKVAQTIADLAGAERIAVSHVAEALQYRVREQPMF